MAVKEEFARGYGLNAADGQGFQSRLAGQGIRAMQDQQLAAGDGGRIRRKASVQVSDFNGADCARHGIGGFLLQKVSSSPEDRYGGAGSRVHADDQGIRCEVVAGLVRGQRGDRSCHRDWRLQDKISLAVAPKDIKLMSVARGKDQILAAIAKEVGGVQQIRPRRYRDHLILRQKRAGIMPLASGQPALLALRSQRIQVAAQQRDCAALPVGIANS